jgi:hypothetical protein
MLSDTFELDISVSRVLAAITGTKETTRRILLSPHASDHALYI